MNQKLPIALIFGFALLGGVFVTFTHPSYAVSVAEQTQGYDSTLNVWQAIQELGNNLSGTLENFTFRVSTSASNIDQFDFAGLNTKIYDKDNNNSYTIPCVSNASDPLTGLTFTTTGVPAGYEDVTIDFSCRNYEFIFGHRYLILLTNANAAQWGGKRMKLATANYSGTSNDYFTGGGVRYAFDNGVCNASSYIWNSQTASFGCNIFGYYKNDLYFVLNNNSPPPSPPRLPVIFIPGIGGSEMKATQDIVWSADNGHGGTYSHAYTADEKIWVNTNEAAALGNDDYFDVLKLKSDGVTSEADLSLTGALVSDGYSQIDSFFAEMGYNKGTNFFVFPYDWRKDVRSTKDSLDALIESARIASGQSQVNLVVHSMGGLVARYYISDSSKATKVNKLIELGVPHLGAVDATKALMYGKPLGRQILGDFYLGIPSSEVKDLFQNFSSAFQLLPSNKYFDFYDNSRNEILYPFKDDRDIDNNNVTGSLNFNQIKTLLTNLNYNMTTFGIAEQFHSLDVTLNQANGVIAYEIVGTSQPTLGQIHETWWITWPINLITKRDEIFINGDGTVPLYSASLKNDSLDISGASQIYYVEQKHSDLVNSSGPAMAAVRGILNDDNLAIPVQVKSEKISLEGEQLTLDDGELDLYDDQNRHCGLNDNGEIEENIPDVTCTTSGNTKHAFVKKKASKVKVKATRKNPSNSSKTTNLKKRTYREDKISKTTLYKDLSISFADKIEFDLDPSLDTSPSLNLYQGSTTTTIISTSEVTGSAATDQTPPSTSIQISGTKNSSGIYTGPVTITLTASDTEAGILKIEYSLDNGQTVQTYSEPFTISTPGTTTLQIKAIDKLGNEEIPQTFTIQIALSPTPAPSSISTTPEVGASSNQVNTSGVNIGSKTNQSPDSILSQSDILGITFKNPDEISDQINKEGFLDQQKQLSINQNTGYSYKEILGGLLIVSGSVASFASFSLFSAFVKQIKYKM
ncbi:hypothetical protein HYS95_01025 [Candidatus Daviesbacteria bacterium]|nr:hypothetical protein [Candidatus Daviesbacteria bacterium]